MPDGGVNGRPKQIKLYIPDQTGREEFKLTWKYQGVHAFIVIYSVTSRDSFKSVNQHFMDIENLSDKNAHKFLVGNKCDL